MTAPISSSLKIAPTDSGYVCRVEGRGTARHSEALRECANKLLEDEEATLVIDLSACEYLDSTFLGCIAHLNKRFRRSPLAGFVVAGSTGHCKSLFGSTRLETLVTMVHNAPEVTGDFEVLTLKDAKRPEFGRHVMESHRTLAEIGGQDQTVFKQIADEISRELGETQPDQVKRSKSS